MTTVETVSREEAESTRMLGARNKAEFLRAVADVTQVRAAACMNVDPSTISRRIKEYMDDACELLGAFGLQVVRTDSMVVDRTELSALESMAWKYLEARRQERLMGA